MILKVNSSQSPYTNFRLCNSTSDSSSSINSNLEKRESSQPDLKLEDQPITAKSSADPTRNPVYRQTKPRTY